MLTIHSSQWESLLTPYQYYVMGRKNSNPAVMYDWFVCLSVVMVTATWRGGSGTESISLPPAFNYMML